MSIEVRESKEINIKRSVVYSIKFAWSVGKSEKRGEEKSGSV